MKKYLLLILSILLCLSLMSCSRWAVKMENSKTTTAAPADTREGFEGVTAPPVENITDALTAENGDEAKKAAAIDAVKAAIGEENSETGLKFVFSYDGTEIHDGTEYIKVRVSEKSEDGVLTLYGYYLADEDGNVTGE